MVGISKDYERGIRIANRRKNLGLSQDELADRVGIGRQALSAIENGGEFKVSTLENLVSALDTSEHYILRGKQDESKKGLIDEAVNELSGISDIQIKQCIEMMKTIKKF